MGNEFSEDDFVFMPFEEIMDPPHGIVFHYKDYYWVVHPTKGLVFFNSSKRYGSSNKYGSPQCNLSEAVTMKLAKSIIPFEYDVVKLMSVFVPAARGYDY